MLTQRLKNARKRAEHTQESLAKTIMVDTVTISKWERGVMQPTLDNIERLARALRTSADYLLGITDDPSPKRGDLSEIEQKAITAWRQGDKMAAIQIIAGGE